MSSSSTSPPLAPRKPPPVTWLLERVLISGWVQGTVTGREGTGSSNSHSPLTLCPVTGVGGRRSPSYSPLSVPWFPVGRATSSRRAVSSWAGVRLLVLDGVPLSSEGGWGDTGISQVLHTAGHTDTDLTADTSCQQAPTTPRLPLPPKRPAWRAPASDPLQAGSWEGPASCPGPFTGLCPPGHQRGWGSQPAWRAPFSSP